MAFFALLWKSRTIEKYRLDYEKEKINSIVMGNTHMEQTLSQRWRHYRYDTQKRISRTFKKWYPEGSVVSNFLLYLTTDQTFPNFLLKSLMGFVGGIILTYLCFMFFVFQLSISLIHATIMSSIIGVLLTLGLAFSYRIRCLVFLLIPQLFSRVGRYTLTCYALVLILTGPATNTLKNSEVLSESMACTQEQIKTSVHELDEMMKKPLNSMKHTLQLMIDRFKIVAIQMRQTVIALNRLVLSLVGFIQHSFSWLQEMPKVCNAKLGTPYKRCTDLLKKGIDDCKILLGPKHKSLCNMDYLSKTVCYTVKPFSAYCYVTDFMDEAIMASIRKKLKNFTAKLRALFLVEVYVHHSYNFSNNSSRTASQVAAGIVTEIRNMTGPLLTWLSWSSCVTSLFLLLIIFRAKYYQHMYETRSRFDNRYVTKELQELDLKRQRQGRETVLPLNRRERAKYITTSSFRLVTSEKVYLTRSAVYMAITTFKLLIHMVADYSLYWVLMTIRHHGKHQSTEIPGVPATGAHVFGSGLGARLMSALVDALDAPLRQPEPSLLPCLPDPYLPDFNRYTQIGVLIVLMWFFALFEPYGLRMRHLIMGQYRPERAKARATWLYNHILRTRAGFMKFARRKLHREYKYSSESVHTFNHWLDEHIPFQCLKYLLGIGPKTPHCLLCGATKNVDEKDTKLIRCETPNCPGTYCTSCFADIGQLCTICMSPADYGDLSDESLEKGSSDDSDSDSDSYETSRADEHSKLMGHLEHQDTHLNTRPTSRKWNVFRKSSRTECYDTTNPIQHNNYEVHKSQLRNKERSKNEDDIKLNKDDSQNFYSNSETAIQNIVLDYNNNELSICDKIVGKTMSQGNKEGHRSKLTKEKFIRFNTISHTLVYKQEFRSPTCIERIIQESNVKSKKPVKIKRFKFKRSSSKRLRARHCNEIWHGLVIALINSKPSERRILYNNYTINNCTIFAYKLRKGFMRGVRFFAENNNRIETTGGDYKDNAKNIDDMQDLKNLEPLDNSTPKDDGEEKVTETTNKPKKISKEKTKKVKIKNKNSRHKISEFHAFFANRWQHVKSNIAFRTSKKSKSKEHLDLNEKKNHKRRKKKDDISFVSIKPSVKKMMKDNKCARNYRISTFLADNDWRKPYYKDTAKAKKKDVDDSCRVAIHPGQRVQTWNKEKLVAMVHMTNKPFQWRENTQETYYAYPGGVSSYSNCSYRYVVYRHNAMRALQRFREKVNMMLTSPPSSFMQKMMSTMNVNRKPTPVDRSVYSPHNTSFYRSFRHELVHPNTGVIDTDILYRNQDYTDTIIPLESHPATRDIPAKREMFTLSSSSTPNIRTHWRHRLFHSNSSVQTRMITRANVERCKCDPLALDQPPGPPEKLTLSKRIKKLCSSLFTVGSEKTCQVPSCVNARERQKQLAISRLCGPGERDVEMRDMTEEEIEAALNPEITDCREKCLPPDLFSKDDEFLAQNIEGVRALAKCREIELDKIREIQRHIEKEKELEMELREEQERHRAKQSEIEKELGLELTRHREKEKRLMCDGDSQTARYIPEETLEKIRQADAGIDVTSEFGEDEETSQDIGPESEMDPYTIPTKDRWRRGRMIRDKLRERKERWRKRWSREKVGVGEEDETSLEIGPEGEMDPYTIQPTKDRWRRGRMLRDKLRDRRERWRRRWSRENVGVSEEDETPEGEMEPYIIQPTKDRWRRGRMMRDKLRERKERWRRRWSRDRVGVGEEDETPEGEMEPYIIPPTKDRWRRGRMMRDKLRERKERWRRRWSREKVGVGEEDETPEGEMEPYIIPPTKDRWRRGRMMRDKLRERKERWRKRWSRERVGEMDEPESLPLEEPIPQRLSWRRRFRRKRSIGNYVEPGALAMEEGFSVDCECAKLLRRKGKKHAEISCIPIRTDCACGTVLEYARNTGTQDSGTILRRIGRMRRGAANRIRSVRDSGTRIGTRLRSPLRRRQKASVSECCDPQRYSPVCIATPLPQGNPFMRSSDTSNNLAQEILSSMEPSNMVCAQVSPLVIPRHTNYLKDTGVQGTRSPSPNTKRCHTYRTCHIKETAVLTKTSATIHASCKEKTKRNVNNIQDSEKLSSDAIKQANERERFSTIKKDTSVLAKFLPKSIAPHVKNLSITNMSPIFKMADKSCSPARTDHSTSIIPPAELKKDSSETKLQKTKTTGTKKETYKSDKHVTQKDNRYTYQWKKGSGNKRSKETKQGKHNPTIHKVMSMESSLYDGDNPSNITELTMSTISASEFSNTSYSISGDEAKTDTTFCSVATVNYSERSRRRLKTVTKANQSTSTEKARLCDTGTYTDDWWSPLLDDREIFKRTKDHVIPRPRREIVDYNSNKRYTRGLSADGKIVKFKSRTQIIPAGLFRFKNDIMSPSRYLLESQKYYNELFAYNMRPPKLFDGVDKPRSSISSRRHHRRTKRLDECYSPRRQYSPRKRYADSTRTPESTQRRLNHHWRDDRHSRVY